MKNILNYQTSEFDCGPTTLCNAMRYLYEREQISPELLKTISLYTLDAYNDEGETGKSGTSKMAMKFLSSWFNQYGKTKKFPIYSEFLEGDQVYIGANSRITSCLQQHGVVVARVLLLGDGHYVLLNSLEDGKVGLFDPYDIEGVVDTPIPGVTLVNDQPKKINRIVNPKIMNIDSKESYSFGPASIREAMLLYNTEFRLTPEKTIEYII